MNEPHAHPKVNPPTRIVVSGSDLTPHLYQATPPARHVWLRRLGQAIFIVILVWLLGIAFISTFGGVK